MRFIHLETVGSTQDEARELYRSGERGAVWIRADAQTRGRGRQEREWVSKTGNLYASHLRPNEKAASESALMGFAAALAIAETVEAYRVVQSVTLKWPNDVLVGGDKISGLLVERLDHALIFGIGINLVSHPDDTRYGATHLVACMSPDDLARAEPLYTGPSAVLAQLAKRMEVWLDRFDADGFEPVRKAWLSRAHHLGRMVTVNGQTGLFQDLGDDGALCLKLADGRETRVHAGDVSFG
ncbi:MAG: biotin--[acetyl-CoA-carboxylase] ligase [Litorimonas sp.]